MKYTLSDGRKITFDNRLVLRKGDKQKLIDDCEKYKNYHNSNIPYEDRWYFKNNGILSKHISGITDFAQKKKYSNEEKKTIVDFLKTASLDGNSPNNRVDKKEALKKLNDILQVIPIPAGFLTKYYDNLSISETFSGQGLRVRKDNPVEDIINWLALNEHIKILCFDESTILLASEKSENYDLDELKMSRKFRTINKYENISDLIDSLNPNFNQMLYHYNHAMKNTLQFGNCASRITQIDKLHQILSFEDIQSDDIIDNPHYEMLQNDNDRMKLVAKVVEADAGSGKSIVSQQIALEQLNLISKDRKRNQRNVLDIVIYIKSRYASKELSVNVSTNYSTNFSKDATYMIEKSHPNITNYISRIEMLDFFAEVQRISKEVDVEYFVYLDALDEAVGHYKNNILHWVKTVATNTLITTRPGEISLVRDYFATATFTLEPNGEELRNTIPLKLCDAWGISTGTAKKLSEIFSTYSYILTNPLYIGWFCMLIYQDKIEELSNNNNASRPSEIMEKIIQVGIRSALSRKDNPMAEKSEEEMEEFISKTCTFVGLSYHHGFDNPEEVFDVMYYMHDLSLTPKERQAIKRDCGLLFLADDRIYWTHQTVQEHIYANLVFEDKRNENNLTLFPGEIRISTPFLSRISDLKIQREVEVFSKHTSARYALEFILERTRNLQSLTVEEIQKFFTIISGLTRPLDIPYQNSKGIYITIKKTKGVDEFTVIRSNSCENDCSCIILELTSKIFCQIANDHSNDCHGLFSQLIQLPFKLNFDVHSLRNISKLTNILTLTDFHIIDEDHKFLIDQTTLIETIEKVPELLNDFDNLKHCLWVLWENEEHRKYLISRISHVKSIERYKIGSLRFGYTQNIIARGGYGSNLELLDPDYKIEAEALFKEFEVSELKRNFEELIKSRKRYREFTGVDDAKPQSLLSINFREIGIGYDLVTNHILLARYLSLFENKYVSQLILEEDSAKNELVSNALIEGIMKLIFGNEDWEKIVGMFFQELLEIFSSNIESDLEFLDLGSILPPEYEIGPILQSRHENWTVHDKALIVYRLLWIHEVHSYSTSGESHRLSALFRYTGNRFSNLLDKRNWEDEEY